MAKVVQNMLELIGDTPIVRIHSVTGPEDAELYGKLESFNPMSSLKDRIALNMIEAAEDAGNIKKGDTLIEPTSGNTGIGLAFVSAIKGYKLILTMPDTMSVERRKILTALGAELVLTEGAKGMKGAVSKAEELASEKGYLILQQFENPANPEIHRKTTAKEILSALPDIDAFVAAVGTGGTITGVGEVLKKEKPDAKIVAVEPEGSPVLSGGNPGPHKIQGIGAGFIPEILDTNVYSEVIKVSNEDAFTTSRNLAKNEGIFVGISAGANVFAAAKLAKKLGKGKKVLTVLCDHGERYLSTALFDEPHLSS